VALALGGVERGCAVEPAIAKDSMQVKIIVALSWT